MLSKILSKKSLTLFSVALCLASVGLFTVFSRNAGPTSAQVANLIARQMLQGQLPSKLETQEGDYNISYTFNAELQEEAEKILKIYQPDYAAVAAIEPQTGRVLTLVSYQRTHTLDEHLALTARFPAASLFKIVTAAAALDTNILTPESELNFYGANHTLYKKNLFQKQNLPWERTISLKAAFGQSINTVFGKIGIEKLSQAILSDYAARFFFNRSLPADVPADEGFARIPASQDYAMAEVASGFNRTNRLSPLQAAVMSSLIAEDGKFPVVHTVQKIENSSGQIFYKMESSEPQAHLTREGARGLQTLMKETVLAGTSRKFFRKLLKTYPGLEVGGKTGSLDATNPAGRCDWFTGYALNGDNRIALAVLTVNVQKWRIRSPDLAQMLIRKYLEGRRVAAIHTPNNKMNQ